MTRWALLFLVVVAACSGPPAGEDLALEYSRRLMQEDLDFLNRVHTAEMASTFDAEKVVGLVEGLQNQHGEFESFGKPWDEGAKDGFARYRIPAVFSRRTMDFRVVLTADDRVAGVFIEPHVDPTDNAEAALEIYVLGAAQDGGVPHVGCFKECCESARREGRAIYPACLGVHNSGTGETLLIEATPAVEPQLALFYDLIGKRGSKDHPVGGVMLTHAHMGHYLGLAHFGREVSDAETLSTWVTPRMGDFLEQNAPWSQLVTQDQIKLRRVELGSPFEPITGLQVTAVQVPHRDEFSDTVAFYLRGPERTALFVPDVDSWDKQKGLLDRLLENVDIAFLDATFYDGSEVPGRDLSEIPHPPITRTVELLRERVAGGGLEVVFIHLNHSNRALHEADIRHKLAQDGFRIAEQGDKFSL